MATLKDLKYSMNGEQPEGASVVEDTGMHIADGGTEPTADIHQETFVIFKLARKNSKGGVYIPNADDVYNEKTGAVERIRLLRGVSSIWMKDQKDLTPEYVKSNGRSLHFPRTSSGPQIMRISTHDKAALDFARTCRWNIKDPAKATGSRLEFYEYDPVKQGKAREKREMFEIEMAIEASKQPEEFMLKHAAYLKIRVVDDYGLKRTISDVRADYILAAKRDPERFQKTLKSRIVEYVYKVRKAVMEGTISLGGADKMARNHNGEIICAIPPAVADPYEHLASIAMQQTPEGKAFAEYLSVMVK